MSPHEYANIFPMLTDPELATLAADIKANGLQSRITTYEGKILDGRNRWRACEIAGVEPRTMEFAGSDPLAFVISHNLHRRHLTESQRGMIAARLATLRNGQNKTAPSSGGAVSQPEAAKMLNVGTKTVERAAAVIRDGAAGLSAAVESGGIQVTTARDIAKLPKPQQEEVIAAGPEAMKAKAKEIREFGVEQVAPKPEAAPKPTRSVYVPAVGLQYAEQAITRLERIHPTDKEFEPAMRKVIDHCNAQLAQRRK